MVKFKEVSYNALYSYKLVHFTIGWGGSGKRGGRGGGQWSGGGHGNQGNYSGGQSAGFHWS